MSKNPNLRLIPAAATEPETSVLDDHDEAGLETAQGGVQSVERAAALVKAIADNHPVGASISELARIVDLPRPTVHRLVVSLVGEGLAQRDETSRKFTLGSDFVHMGVTTTTLSDLVRVGGAIISRIAAITNDMVCISLRAGFDNLILAEIPATSSLSEQMRLRRFADPAPLGANPSGVAMLAGFSPGAVRAIVKHNAGDPVRHHRTDIRKITQAVETCRRAGYSMMLNYYFADVSGIAVAVPNGDSPPFLALSNTSTTDRIDGPRKQMIVDLLKREAEDFSFQLRQRKIVLD